MNILWIPNFLPFPADNGGKVVISNRIKQVARKNSIYLIVEGKNELDLDAQKMICKYCKKLFFIEPPKRNKLFLLKHLLIDSLNVGRYKNEKISDAVLKCVKKYKIDIINLDLPMVYVNLLPIEKQIFNIPVLINQHNIEYKNVLSKISVKGLNPILKIYALIEAMQLQKWEKKIYKKSNVSGFTFVSDVDMREFQKEHTCFGKKLFLSPIGTEIPDASSREYFMKLENKSIVFPAAFDYAPNIFGAKWFVTEVIPLIRKKCNDFHVYFVGKSPSPEILKLQNEYIHVTGTVPSMIPYMKSASLFVVPIFFGGGVKTKLIEMGCWKKPIVSTTEGCKGTVFKSGEDIIVANTPETFANACIDALDDPTKFESCAERTYQKTVDNYLWDNIGIRYCDFLVEVKNGAKK